MRHGLVVLFGIQPIIDSVLVFQDCHSFLVPVVVFPPSPGHSFATKEWNSSLITKLGQLCHSCLHHGDGHRWSFIYTWDAPSLLATKIKMMTLNGSK
mmetsp:Transcript_76746/g.206831  ORF Transcript_76746/g.206831 Transcript_76746/m.206831 type:complete len:97 (+) Transcript_76746:2294-2584(+)